jgi:fructuronate reductase
MLNGAHSLIAYQGLIAGYETVDEAISDSEILKSVNEWWTEVEKVLSDPQLNLASYKSALLDRFRNPKIAHRLSQIAIDGSTKLSLRIIPVIRELPESKPAAFVIAQWIKWVASQELVNDTRSAEVMRVKNSPQELVALLDSSVAASRFMNLINLELKTTSV